MTDENAPYPELPNRTRVWVLLELEHNTDHADAKLFVSEFLDTRELQDAIRERAFGFGRDLRVTAAHSNLDLDSLQARAREEQ
jgi:hypothetical protein